MQICFPLNLPLCKGLIHEVGTLQIANEFALQNHKVTYLYAGKTFSLDEIKSYYGFDASLIKFIPHFRLKTTFLKWQISSRRVALFGIKKTIKKMLLNNDCDIIFTNDTDIAKNIYTLVHKSSVPVILEVHRPPTVEFLHLISVFDYVFCLSQQLVNAYIRLGFPKNKIGVLPLSPYSESFTPTRYDMNCKFNTLIYMGQLNEDRGVSDIIDAITILGDPYRLIVFGGPSFTKLRQYAEHKGVLHKISFKGYIPPGKLYKELQNHNGIIVIPPRQTEKYNMMAHTKISDAIATGMIIIASDLESIKELINDKKNGFLFHAGQAQSLANEIIRVSTLTPQQILDVQKNMEHTFLNLNYKARYEKIIQVIESLYPRSI